MAREEERRRIRNDLHDDLGPRLAATALQLENAVELVAEDPGRAVQVLERATGYLRDGVADVRRIVDDLRPAALDDLGLVQAVREQAARLGEHGLSVSVATDGDLAGLPAAAEVAAYRITAEAMTNVARHAGARHLRVRLARVADGIAIEVADDGRGLPDDWCPASGSARCTSVRPSSAAAAWCAASPAPERQWRRRSRWECDERAEGAGGRRPPDVPRGTDRRGRQPALGDRGR